MNEFSIWTIDSDEDRLENFYEVIKDRSEERRVGKEC